MMIRIATRVDTATLVTAELSTDKESYVDGDTAELKLKVSNGYNYKLDNLTAKISLPEGFKVQSGQLLVDNFSLEAGESKTTNIVTLQVQEQPGGITIPRTGDVESIVWGFLAVLSGAVLLALGLKGNSKKKIISLLLCFAILLTSIPIPVSAAETSEEFTSITVEKKVKIDGNEKIIKAEITYNGQNTSDDDSVTITFQSFDGTLVDAITVEKGEAPGRLPQPYQTGKAFLGW